MLNIWGLHTACFLCPQNYKPVVIKAAALLYAHVHRLPIPKELEAGTPLSD